MTTAIIPLPVSLSTPGVIPRRFEHASFQSFEPVTASQRAAAIAVRQWLADLEHGPMLALVGSQGAGKSHLLYAAARELYTSLDRMDAKERAERRTVYPFVAPWYQLADQLRYGRTIQTEGGSREQAPAEVRAALWGRPVVLLDEVRRTSGTDFDDSELAKFACHAYDQRIAVLLTTNVHPLADVMGPAAASRFAQVVIEGPDARQAGSR